MVILWVRRSFLDDALMVTWTAAISESSRDNASKITREELIFHLPYQLCLRAYWAMTGKSATKSSVWVPLTDEMISEWPKLASASCDNWMAMHASNSCVVC
ncbi:hypothetical protein HZH68_004345 [Vespula germanica]|uniref:Uncharacterized protein n=3 Tax=Vespula TaxID=7451 RepID=A0A834KRN9_VESGE|nr:hypothetical protein HZH66_003962 [Vespula vulgaris]KAF7409964.1 hypothetical protein HZH68_004345 [Vespula germanica]